MSVVALTKQLISCPSITPQEAGCHDVITTWLANLGFVIEKLSFGQVENLWAKWGTRGPLLVFAGHSDVVPPGDENAWRFPPFEPTEKDGFLYGRGAVDMKGGLAAMMIAVAQFLKKHPDFPGSLAFLITSDEEGASIDGTRRVIEILQHRNEKIAYCIIGEPASEHRLGDQIRIGRRGSLHGKLVVYGKQGHIAYPVVGQNPLHSCLALLQALVTTPWDQGNAFFPPTSFQLSNIQGGTGALNMTPSQIEIYFNLRFSSEVTALQLQQRVEQMIKNHSLVYDLQWTLSGEPFLTPQGKLLAAATEAIQDLMGVAPQLSTGGGTSDGRFIAVTGAEIVEVGLIHATAHQRDEKVALEDLENLPAIYEGILTKLFLEKSPS